MIRPLGNHYLCRPLEPEKETASGLALPDTALLESYDSEILAVGPGRTLEGGAVHPMQGKVGDRAIVVGHDFRMWDWQWKLGFVRDEDLVALITDASDWEDLLPANDWVLIEPDRQERVAKRASGLLVAAYALPGGGAREAAERGEEDHTLYRSSQEPVRRGRVVAMGPGAVEPDGHRGQCIWPEWWVADRILADLTPACSGIAVHWDKDARGVDLWDGGRKLVAIRAGQLCAVEVEG